jgi:hypothetical protein
MAKTENQHSFEQRHRTELSVGSYLFEQLKGLVPLTTALGAGFLWRHYYRSITNAIPKIKSYIDVQPASENFFKELVTYSSAFIGLLSGSIPLGYQGWRKNESARLAAQEINEDISNMKIMQPTDAELIKENDALREMLKGLNNKPKVLINKGELDSRLASVKIKKDLA